MTFKQSCEIARYFLETLNQLASYEHRKICITTYAADVL